MTAPTDSALPDLIPARMVNEFVYCPRLAYLEWVQGEWDDNADTVHGKFVHRRVDQEPASDVPAPEQAEAAEIITRSVMLSSEELGAIARVDLLELEGKQAVPVDYKRGPLPPNGRPPYDPERVQLCLQGLLLRGAGYECPFGILYFSASKTRVEVPFDDELVALTLESLAGIRGMAQSPASLRPW